MCTDLHPRRSTLAVASSLVDDDEALVDRLRSGDESAFVDLVRRYQPRLLRVAEATVGRGSVAQEVTQDTWLAVFRGIDRFEGRSSFKSWLFSILLNRARSAARREDRAGRPDSTIGEERFDANGAWAQPPEPWADRAVDRLVAAQLLDARARPSGDAARSATAGRRPDRRRGGSARRGRLDPRAHGGKPTGAAPSGPSTATTAAR